jgi:hypothetical protein
VAKDNKFPVEVKLAMRALQTAIYRLEVVIRFLPEIEKEETPTLAQIFEDVGEQALKAANNAFETLMDYDLGFPREDKELNIDPWEMAFDRLRKGPVSKGSVSGGRHGK